MTGIVRERWDHTTRTYTSYDETGVQQTTRPFTAAENTAADQQAVETTRQTNRATIEQKAVDALAANATYLAIASPTNAQNAAQVKLLTRECTATIKLLLNLLDDTTGT